MLFFKAKKNNFVPYELLEIRKSCAAMVGLLLEQKVLTMKTNEYLERIISSTLSLMEAERQKLVAELVRIKDMPEPTKDDLRY